MPLWLALTIVAALLAIGPIWHGIRNWRERSRELADAMDETAAD